MEAHNAYAGQGPVMLDIGDDIGALVIEMPAELEGIEIEIRPVGSADSAAHAHGDDHAHAHGDDHGHAHGDDHGHAHGDDHGHSHGDHSHRENSHPHVAVVARPVGGAMVPSAVFGDLREGDYELYERITGLVELTVQVRGGEVTQARWPAPVFSPI